MEIKERSGYFLIKNKDVSVILVFNPNAKIKDDADIVVNHKLPDAFNITRPGEYEVKQVFVMAFEKSDKKAYLINIEDVNILFSDTQIDFSKEDLDNLSTIDILIFLNEDLEISSNTVKFVNKLDPKVLLLHDGVNEEEIKKMFSGVITEMPKKYKTTAGDFDVEDYKLSVVKIKND